MALLQEPFLNLLYNETYQSQGWNLWNDENIISCSFYLSATLDGKMGSPPGAMYDGAFTFDGALLYDGIASDLVDGRTYLVSSPAAGDWVGQEGKLATVVENGWKFYPSVVGQTMFNTVDGSFYLNTGDGFINKDDYGVFPSPSISCAYPLNMTQAQAISLTADDLLPSTGRVASYTLSAGDTVGSAHSLFTGPDISAPQIVDISQGKNTVECVLNTRQLVSDGIVSSTIQFFNPVDSSLVLMVSVLRNNLSIGGDDILVVDQFGIANSAPITAADSHVVGVVFDSTTGKYSVIIDGVVVSLLRDDYTAPNAVILPAVNYEFVSKDPADNGKVLSIELRTSASDMTQTYPPGTTDICGNLLS